MAPAPRRPGRQILRFRPAMRFMAHPSAGNWARSTRLPRRHSRGKRMVRVGMKIAVYPLAAGEHPFEGLPKL
jgi:hypothetical protein